MISPSEEGHVGQIACSAKWLHINDSSETLDFSGKRCQIISSSLCCKIQLSQCQGRQGMHLNVLLRQAKVEWRTA